MSDPMEHGQHERAEYEREDLTARNVFSFLIGLVVMGVVVFGILKVMTSVLEGYNRAHQPPQNPLVAKTPGETREVAPGEVGKFPNPRLETDEVHELRDIRDKEEKALNSYGWVDQNVGTVHIPIERAMQLIVQRGLPTQVKAGAVPASPVNVGRQAAEKADKASAQPQSKRKK
jgi:hypothetical protein